MNDLQDALDTISDKLKGRTIIDSGVDRDASGYHIFLDDGNILISVGIIGVYRPVTETLQ